MTEPMNDTEQRIAALSPEQRELLLHRLRERTRPESAASSMPPAPEVPCIPVGPFDPGEPSPLSDIQAAFWMGGTGLYDLGGSSANVYIEYEFPGDAADFAVRLNDVVAHAVARHPILRTVVSDDGLQRILAETPPYEAEVKDLTRLSGEEIESYLESTREELRYARHASDRWPLFDMVLHQLQGERIRFQARFDAMLVDGTSRNLLINELIQGLLDGERVDAPKLEVDYLDHIRAVQAFRQSATWERCRAYWLERLPSLPSAPRLPLARDFGPETVPRIVKRTHTVLDPPSWAALRQQAAWRGITPSGIVAALVAETLRSWSEEPSFTLGLSGTYCPPIHPQVRQVIGTFTSLYLLVVEDVAGPFESRARRLQDRLSADLDHQHFSGHEVLRELNRTRRAGGRATLPVHFTSVLHSGSPQPLAAQPEEEQAGPPQGLDLTLIDLMISLPQVLLFWVTVESPDGSLLLISQAVEEVLPPGLAVDLIDGYRSLADRLAREEAAWSEQRPLRLPAAVFVAESTSDVGELSLAALFAEQARARPEAPALVTAGRTVSYGELDRWSLHLARRLRVPGSRLGLPVAVVLEPGWQQAAATLAVLRSGAACVPLDPALSPTELQRRLAWSGAALAITSPGLADRLAWPDGVQPVTVDGDEQAAVESGEDLDAELQDGRAWIFGGKDGQTVTVDRGGAAAAASALGRLAELAPGDRLLALSLPGSDLALCEIFGTLATGATLVLPAAGEHAPEALAALAARERVTVWSSAPAVFEAALDRIEHERRLAPHTLDRILLHRDRIPVRLPERLRALKRDARVVATWGAPGAPVAAAGPVGEADHAQPAGNCPRLQAVAGWRLHVLDGDLAPRPAWVPGDLYLGQGEDSGERLTPAGERARRLPDGRIEVLGDEREPAAEALGYGADPRRVEAALQRHPAVRHAVVAWRGSEWRLAAWLVLRPDKASTDRELRHHLEATLPKHLVPAVFVRLKELPLTPDGRVDRAALVVPTESPQPADAALGPVESELAGLWEEILAQRPTALDDDFFDLGGNSLLAARLMGRLAERFGLEGPLAGFLERPLLGHLAELVSRARAERAERLPGRRWRDSLAALRTRILPPPTSPTYGMNLFLVIWIGQFISAIGTALGSFSLGVWVYEKTGSTTQFAMIAVLAGIVMLVTSPFSGAFADRWDRRKLMLVANIGSAVMTVGLASLMLYGRLETWHVYPFIVTMVALGSVQGPALNSSISLLVPRRHLARAAGMSQMSRAVAQIIGPLAAGILVVRIGYYGLIYIDCATFLAAAATLLFVRIPSPPRAARLAEAPSSDATRRSVFGDLADGWAYIRERPGLFALLSMYALTNFCMATVQVLLTPLILSFATPVELGSVNSAAAAGVLLGSLTLSLWGGPRSRVWTIFAVLVFQGCVLFLGGVEPSIPLISMAAFGFMFTAPILAGCNQAILQSKVAPEVQGRVFGMAAFIVACTLPLASGIAGPLVDRVFQPLLSPDGALAATFVGRLVGLGPGRGAGLLFILLGALVILIVSLAFLNPRLRRVETELPDAVHPESGVPRVPFRPHRAP